MSRPTHAMQQRTIDDDLAALPSQRWRWLFTPDPRWLAAVNTTTLREVNAVRMFVVTTVAMLSLGNGVTAYALGRCHWSPGALGPGETAALVQRLCEESTATARMLDFAAGIFNSYFVLLGAMATVAVGGMFLKRTTDTEHVERKERAKKAPIIQAGPITAEHQALAPVSQTVNLGDDAIAAAANGPARSQGGDSRAEGMDDSRRDDETGPP